MSHSHRATCQPSDLSMKGCWAGYRAARMQASFARTVADANNSMVVELSSSWRGFHGPSIGPSCECGGPFLTWCHQCYLLAPLTSRRSRNIGRIDGATTISRGCVGRSEALIAGDATGSFSLSRYFILLAASQQRSSMPAAIHLHALASLVFHLKANNSSRVAHKVHDIT